jgi:multidrug efflux system membrane fusion protein
VSLAPIKVAAMQDGKAIVDSGLAPGTRVIVDGQYKVRPGVKVTESPGRGTPAPAPAPATATASK